MVKITYNTESVTTSITVNYQGKDIGHLLQFESNLIPDRPFKVYDCYVRGVGRIASITHNIDEARQEVIKYYLEKNHLPVGVMVEWTEYHATEVLVTNHLGNSQEEIKEMAWRKQHESVLDNANRNTLKSISLSSLSIIKE
jgi:hypothetical protein